MAMFALSVEAAVALHPFRRETTRTRWSACDVTIRAAGDPCLLDMATTSIQRRLVEEVEEEEPLPLHAHFHGTLGKSLEDNCHSV